MKIKYLVVLPLLVMCVLGWYFLGKNTPKTEVALGKPNIHSQIDGIQAIQTNPDTGKIEYTLTAKSLAQSTNGQDALYDVVMDWIPDAISQYTIIAKQATFNQNTGDFEFDGGFSLHQHSQTGDMTLTGSTLIGNTKNKLIHSNAPMNITQGHHKFKAMSMMADLTTKDYQFFGIDISFMPSERQDKPLFH